MAALAGAGGTTALADKACEAMNAGAETAGTDCTTCVGVGVWACAEPASAKLSTKTSPVKQTRARKGKCETLNIKVFMAGLGWREQRLGGGR